MMNRAQDRIQVKRNRLTVYEMTLTGLMAAVLCVLGPVSLVIGVSPVPISLGTLAVCLAAAVLGPRLGTLSCLLYLLLGLAGLPVFTGYTGGAGKLMGPTGGYLIGYLPLALTAGFAAARPGRGGWRRQAAAAAGMALGTLVLCLVGTLWLAYGSGMGFYEALWAGVIPFIPGDLVKMAAAALLGTTLRARLIRAGLLDGTH